MLSNTENTFQNIIHREQGLHRNLSSRQMSMIAIGTGLFLGSSFAISFAGPSVLINYAIGAFITLLLMGCLAEMTVAHPTSVCSVPMPSITEEGFADTPRGKQGQWPSGLSTKQSEITLSDAGASNFNFVECFHRDIVVNCRKNRNC